MLKLPSIDGVLLSIPTPHVLLVTLNCPERLNALRSRQHAELDLLFRWFDTEPSLWCAVLTGIGRAFCVGADLKEWKDRTSTQSAATPERWNTSGFGGLSNRIGKKPVIAAINGLCLGGGMEMTLNCDLIVAGTHGVKFGLPEAKRGVVASAGALPRLIRAVGRQRASEMALLGRMYSTQQMQSWGLVNLVVDNREGREKDVEMSAIRLAQELVENSPDSVIASREGLRYGLEPMSPILATEMLGRGLVSRMDGGENMREGLVSFAERRKPTWKDSKL